MLARLVELAALGPDAQAAISARAVELVKAVRKSSDPRLMEAFLSEYGLSTAGGRGADVPGRGAAAGARRRDDGRPDPRQDRAARLVGAFGRIRLDLRQRLDLGADADGPRAGGGRGRHRAHAARHGAPAGRAGDPHAPSAAAMREMGEQFVLGRTIDEARAARPADDGEGLSLLLRHAGRGGAHRGRRQALSPCLSRTPSLSLDSGCDQHRHRPQSGHLGQAFGAASALRDGAEGGDAAGHGAAAHRRSAMPRTRPEWASTSTPRRPTGWTCRST